MRIAIRADASPHMGGGHVMRCFALAERLSSAGAAIDFVCAALSDALAERITSAGFALHRIGSDFGSHRIPGWEDRVLDEASQARDLQMTAEALGAKRVDWCIVDHYQLDRHWQAAARRWAARILVIDDLANRLLDCDLVLDQTLGRDPRDYARQAPVARMLTGPTYALLRAEFAAARPAALSRRRKLAPVSQLVILLGATDVDGITGEVVQRVLSVARDCAVDAIVPAGAPSLGSLEQLRRRDCRLVLHVDPANIAALLARADLGVGAAGATSWERCCLGLPSVALVLAENQRFLARKLEGAGAVTIATSIEALGSALANLMDNGEARLRMIAAAAAIADGAGSARVAAAMVGECASADLSLRVARDDDVERVWLWRNDPVTRSASQVHEPVTWPEHRAWWRRSFRAPGRHFFIIQTRGDPVGMIRLDRLDEDPQAFEISINLSAGARGRGIGAEGLRLACKEEAPKLGAARLHATIAVGNGASAKIFERLGFRACDALADDGFRRYLRAGDLSMSECPNE